MRLLSKENVVGRLAEIRAGLGRDDVNWRSRPSRRSQVVQREAVAAADPEVFGQFSFGGEAPSGFQGSFGDELFEDGDQFDGNVFFSAFR